MWEGSKIPRMLIWFILFFLVVAISFVLAYQSMSDYEERPLVAGKIYSLFLIQKPEALTEEIFGKFHAQLLKEKAIISLERLFKGQKKALVIFGPSQALQPFTQDLGLIELEDYSRQDKVKAVAEEKNILAWEQGIKKQGLGQEKQASGDIAEDLPSLLEKEQFWWQLILKPQKSTQPSFQVVIRAVFLAENKKRVTELETDLFKIGKRMNLTMLPQVYSSAQMLDFYRQRILPPKSHPGLEKIKMQIILGPGEIKGFLGPYTTSSSPSAS